MGRDKAITLLESANSGDVLFVSDLDGTLLGDDRQVSPQSVGMLNEAIAGGINFSIATARTPATVANLMRGINLNMDLAVMTGAALWNPADGKYSHPCFHTAENLSRLLDIYRKNNLPTFIYTLGEDMLTVYHAGALDDRQREFIAERVNSPYKRMLVPEEGESELPEIIENAVLLFAMQPTDRTEKVYNEIAALGISTPVFYHDMYGPQTGMLEVFAPGSSKADAVERLRKASGAKLSVAFGDNVNDLPMLKRADVAVAVGNAVDEVKACADIIIAPNTEDSVARFISDFAKGKPLRQ